MVYVLNCKGQPAMPCSEGKARRLLKQGKAKIVTISPFTIRLTECYGTAKQQTTIGIDAGYQTIGFSVICEQKELLCGELQMLEDMSERLKERRMYRRTRRNRLRYRKPRFDNRKKQKGWLAPSIEHKYQAHIKIIEFIQSILAAKQTIVEVASFDIQKIKNPEIESKEYQNGEQKDFYNLREYLLHRDHHQCQNPHCKNRAKQPILQIHHLGYWRKDRSDRPGNLITLCNRCHTSKNHKEKGFLYGWKPKVKTFRDATFMTSVRWKMVENLKASITYGYITKRRRKKLNLAKSHANDAFVIAGGTKQIRSHPLSLKQIRRNNRSLQKFYDAKYIDARTGEKASGKELHSGRTCRNKEKIGENLREHRREKCSKGRVSIRRKRYPLQPNDIVKYGDKKYTVKGVQNYGDYVRLKELPKPVNTSLVKPYLIRKGISLK